MFNQSKDFILWNFFIFLTIIIGANGDCCWDKVSVEYFVPNVSGTSTTWICMDGTKLTGWFCGKGECDMVGCYCDGGCRTNSENTEFEAAILFKERYGFKVKSLNCKKNGLLSKLL